jgi:phage major head subunit gpT-like protein
MKEETIHYKALAIDECPEEFIDHLKDAYDHRSFPMVLGYTAASKTYGWIGGCDDLMAHLDNPKKF